VRESHQFTFPPLPMSLLPYRFVCLVLFTLSLLLTFTLVLYTMYLSSERHMNMKKLPMVKEGCEMMIGKSGTEAPVNGGRNYNSPKVAKCKF
jgi:hypothetical protein